MTKLMSDTKKRVADLNQSATQNLTEVSHTTAELQTFVKCADCHTPQYDFYKKTPHFLAYNTLVTKKQQFNKDCLTCHTLGMNQPSGWNHVDKLVFNAAGKPVPTASFMASLPQMPATAFTKYQKAFVNVQCEHCHGPGNDHPFGAPYSKTVAVTACLKCHTVEQAPQWYSSGKPNLPVINAKVKQVGCPRSQ